MTVGIVGLGLIGGSIGLALRDPGRSVIGYDPSESAADIALARFCVDRLVTLEEVAACSVVFVAVPPRFAVDVIAQLYAARGEQTVITDCTSIKGEVVAWAQANRAQWFVPGHPMAGHEKTSAAYATGWMFRGAKWLLTPTDQTRKSAVRTVESLVKAMGAEAVRLAPEVHDRQVAVLSHLPHAMAAALVLLAADLERTDIGAGSWRDLTRVGGVDPNLWTQILSGNREELARVLADAEGHLRTLREALEADDSAAVKTFLDQARTAKMKHA